MATVRDPNFWKRFSAAIHMDEEAKAGMEKEVGQSSDSKKSSRPKLEPSESWLDRERVKRKRRNYMCWGFWVGFLSFIAGLAVLIVWLDNTGVFHRLNEMTVPQQDDDRS
ncbi:hypothetical protein DIS24_g175 [Lasiodiplodia hormozganensis]|uniref:Uncharacterized protein n=1 Tax=Lasiodiplodia hormozganensis TaxID=869390 RepID=A0AA40D6W8_9PEZI|nr:hypothetical protein DIS24_g175 [Lasiodiplodia hormozganensis]